jgi:hypothetical protein
MSEPVALPTPSLRRFELVRTLGAGGMGVVYEVVDRERGSHLALKMLAHMEPDPRLRFKNEFRSLQDIHHPNLVRLDELLEEDGQLFFTMELVHGVHFLDHVRPFSAPPPPPGGDAGEPLVTVVQRVGAGAVSSDDAPPPSLHGGRSGCHEGRLRAALGELARGIAAIHRAGRVHRDIKSSNVLVTPEGRVVVLDFGLITETAHGERDAGVVGTAHFMAPEQAAGLRVGPAADWYSVGILIYAALTGVFPFQADRAGVISLKQRFAPPPPSRIVPGLPADLEALCLRLLRRDPAERPSEAEIFAALGSVDEAPPRRRAPGAAFVGRGAELAALAGAFAEVRRGAPAAIIVEGESGMGKSALVRRFLDQLGGDVEVFAGRCYERESVPYKAVDELVDALSRHLLALSGPDRDALTPLRAAALATVFPVLGAAWPEASRSPDRAAPARVATEPHEVRAAAFSALRELLQRLASIRPVVLAIDDLQWTDADSLALLADVMRPPGAPALLFVATLRTAPDGAARRPIALPMEGVRRVRLDRLSEGEAEALAGDHQARLDAAAIAREANGHPLFIDALVHHRLAQAGDDGRVRLDDALWSRIQRLDAGARRLLEIIAVAGAPLSVDVAGRAAGAGAEEVDRALTALRVAGLARTTGAGRAQIVESCHDRIRETVASRLDVAARRGAHEQLARALEADRPGELEALAQHFRDAGDRDRAAGYAAQAGDHAAAALAFDRAARLYRTALQLRLGPRGGPTERALLVSLGDALRHAGRGAEAAAAYLDAARGAAPDEALALERRGAEALLRAGYIDEGLAHLRHVLAEVGVPMPGNDPLALAALLAQRARLRVRGLRFVERPERAIDPRVLTKIDVCWSTAQGMGLVDPLRGSVFQVTSLLLALDAGEPFRVARSLAQEIGFAAIGGGRAEARVDAMLVEADALVARTEHPYVRATVTMTRGMAFFVQGRFRESRACQERAEVILREQCTGVSWELGTMLTFLLADLWLLGDTRELVRRGARAVREAEERGDRFLATNLRSGLANSRWFVEDRPDRAAEEAAAAIDAWSREGFHLQHYYDLIAKGQHGLYVGEPERGHRYLEERWPALQRSFQLRVESTFINIHHLRARTTLGVAAARPVAERAPLLARVERDAHAILGRERPWGAAFAAMSLAGVAALRGRRDEALPLALDAARRFDAVDMALYAAAARRRWGELLGGDQGRALVAAANRWMRDGGVLDPDRLTAMLAPGF